MKTKRFFSALALMAVAMVFASCSKDNNDPVGPTQQEIETKIIGKWKRTMADGKELITNNSEVFTFNQNGVGTHSMSIFQVVEKRWVWNNKLDMNYSVTNNKICIKQDATVNLSVDEIKDGNMLWTYESIMLNGVDIKDYNYAMYKKVTVDYSNDIIGMWEGVEMTGYETYGNAEARIEYRADGTYTYYKKEGDYWVPSSNVDNEYNVDGDWLATRWRSEAGKDYNYEWWDIDYIKDGTMKWSALREKEDGSRFTTTFTWKKVK
ncbi:MAG: hypothetical protein KBT33_06765 [Prevotellaceae bacterium]|nr:hypothetical protein [Candidatus Minthosoma equi]